MSPQVQTRSISPKAQQWLQTTRQPRLLQVFAPAINLANQNDAILSIVIPQIGNGPFSIVVEADDFASLVDTQPPIHLADGQLRIGDLIIVIEDPSLWHPQPDWAQMTSVDFAPAAQIIETVLGEEAPPDSVAALVVNRPSRTYDRFQQAALKGVQALTAGLQQQDRGLLANGAGKLAGLGIGLTPAGDDFLVGVMHGLWAVRDRPTADQLSKTILAASAGRTNILSTAWLEAAAEGEVGETWHTLLGAVQDQNMDLLKEAVFRILPTGHTSGADALGGFLYILQLELNS